MAESMDTDTSEEPLLLQQDLSCPVCRSIYREPVLLPCAHSFCRECFERSFRYKKECPFCRKPVADVGQAVSNLALRNACESFLKETNWRANQKRLDEFTCLFHLKPLELYCEKDEEAVCVDCVSLHNTHMLHPVRKGADICKKELDYKVKIFEKKVESHRKMTQNLNNAVEYIKYQAEEAEKQIKAEFQRLRAALDAEEALRLKAVAGEQEQKTAAIKEMIENTKKDIADLKELIDGLKKEMGNEDLPLIRNFQNLKREAHWSRKDPCLSSDHLLNMGMHVGGLSFKIWKNLQEQVKYYPVVFDPNTASPWLFVSPDLTSVKENPELQTIPDTTERFDPCVFVLGADGYASGKHRWDVHVGENPKWIVGVCKESVIRKKKFTVSTNRGVWAIGLSKDEYTVLTAPDRQKLQVEQPLEKIRIKLNMEKGEVSFWDAGTAKHLVTLTHKFEGKIFPIFGPGLHSVAMALPPGKMAVHTT